MRDPRQLGIVDHLNPKLFVPEPDNRTVIIQVPMYRAYCCCCFATFLVDKSLLRSCFEGGTVQIQDRSCRCGGAVYADTEVEPITSYWLVREPGETTYEAYTDIDWIKGTTFDATNLFGGA